jgi:hypothetical protein
LNKLLDYDYICKCINNQQPIELIYAEKYSEMESIPISARLADLDDMLIDGAISREVSETEVTEIYLEREFVPSKPFWSFAGDFSEFQIKVRSTFHPSRFSLERISHFSFVQMMTSQILDCENVNVDVDYRNRGGLYIAVGMYFGGKLIDGIHMSEIIPSGHSPSWNQEITFDVSMASIPRVRLADFIYLSRLFLFIDSYLMLPHSK